MLEITVNELIKFGAAVSMIKNAEPIPEKVRCEFDGNEI
jgi:hypothetical protein